MPDSTNDLLSRAQELHLAGKLAEAAELYGRANRLQPDDAECLYFHGLALFQLGRANEAVGLVRRAIALDASVPEYYCDLGAILLALGDSISSIAAVRQALSLRPDFPEAMFTLGNALCRSGQFDEGIEWYQRAITMLGNAVDATNNLGMAYLTLGRVSEAIECFDKRSAINPADASSHSNRIFAMHFSPQFGPIDIQNELACWNRIHAEPLSSEHVAFNNSRAINRPLRVGYVSADFREHVVGWNLLSWLPYHDRNQFHISCYSNVRCPDDMTRQLQSHVDCWRDISSVGDADAARLIRHDRVDILVDLSLHTSGNRLLVFARKPAPIQLTYLAYPGSSGLETMDYRLSDPVLDPLVEKQREYSEQTLHLPATYWCYKPGGPTGVPSLPPALAAGVVTFGCLNQFQKVSTDALDAWREILREARDSRLLMHSPKGRHRADVLARLANVGIDQGRVEFIDRLPWAKYIQTYQRIDIALDPYPYCGGITTCDALWMGVPVITLRGKHPVSRTGASILNTIGLGNCVAESREQYVELASRLARDVRQLCDLRARLRNRMIESRLMNGPHFARDIEALYLQAWQEWVSCQA